VSPNQPDVLFATLCLVTKQPRQTRETVGQLGVRRAVRILAPGLALLVTCLTGALSSAHADAPDTWENSPAVDPLHAVLVLAVIPLGLFLLITLLVYIPSMSKAETYKPGQAWRGEPTWFGGPRGGLEAAERGSRAEIGSGRASESGESKSSRGGVSGRW
jgi:hypothetical protein